jgi:hypothetical protein
MRKIIKNTVFSSSDCKCLKSIFDDGQQVIIKDTSCMGKKDKLNLFIDSSVGCAQGCKFCWCTLKKIPYHPISRFDSIDAISYSMLTYSRLFNSSQSSPYSLKFMGQGDAFFDIKSTQQKLNLFGSFSFPYPHPQSISFSSVFPKKTELDEIRQLLLNASVIAPIKVYLLLGSFIDDRRQELLGKVHDAINCLSMLQQLRSQVVNPLCIGIHYTPVTNESYSEIKSFFQRTQREEIRIDNIRLIPYNSCTISTFQNNTITEQRIIRIVSESNPYLICGVQKCPQIGLPISATCGMIR